MTEQQEKLLWLWDTCQSFVRNRDIHCSESIHQTDRVSEGAKEFIEEVCDIVGYHKSIEE